MVSDYLSQPSNQAVQFGISMAFQRKSDRGKRPNIGDDFVYGPEIDAELAGKQHRKRAASDPAFYPADMILLHKVSYLNFATPSLNVSSHIKALESGEISFLIKWVDGSEPTWQTDVSEKLYNAYVTDCFRTVSFIQRDLLAGPVGGMKSS